MEVALIVFLFVFGGFCLIAVVVHLVKRKENTSINQNLKQCDMCDESIKPHTKFYALKDEQSLCVSCYEMLERIKVLLPSDFLTSLSEMTISNLEKELTESETILDYWHNEDIHFAEGQEIRQTRSRQVNLPFLVDAENKIYQIHGASIEPYRVSLLHCSCKDFASRGLPCKHMYRVASDLGIFK